MDCAVLTPPEESLATPGTPIAAALPRSLQDDLEQARCTLGFDITMAFQPIVDMTAGTVWAYEALVRGTDGAGAPAILARLNDHNRYAFDQLCRVKSIELAARLGIAARGSRLSMNFIPALVYNPVACLRRTLQAAALFGFPLEAIVFEITEGERVEDAAHMQAIANEYKRHGFALALDDFGTGFSGLAILAELQGVSLVKLDGSLIRGIHYNARAERIVASVVSLCRSLNIRVLAECVETPEECKKLLSLDIHLMQGYLFARPLTEALPEVTWPDLSRARRLKPRHEKVKFNDMYG